MTSGHIYGLYIINLLVIISFVVLTIFEHRLQTEVDAQEVQVLSLTTRMDRPYVSVGDYSKLYSDATATSTFTLPDIYPQSTADVVVTQGDQIISGQKTFVDSIVISDSVAPLSLGSGVNRLVLDIGVSAAARAYTVPDVGTSATFVMTEGAQTLNGIKSIEDGIKLGGQTSVLDYFETTSIPILLSGPWATPQSTTLYFHRVGKQVTMEIGTVSATATSGVIIGTNNLHPVPIRFRPRNNASSDVVLPIVLYDNGTIKPGFIVFLSNSGNFELALWDPTTHAPMPFTGSGATGLVYVSVPYLTL